MSKEDLKPQDLIDLLNNSKFDYIITRPSKGHYRLDIKQVIHKCFTCKNEYHVKELAIRQDSRLTNLYLPKKFCKSCVKVVDDILQRYKGNSIPRHLSKLG